ncbi:MAG: hypothetical protein KDD76_05830, partial [Rickettsiales bacterium]|nr:hypothetical protein [Rickettsiales bacterium]
DALFQQYLEICNQALETHKDEFPYKQLWHAAQSMLRNRTVSLAVLDDHPKMTYDLKMADDHIEVLKASNQENKDAWNMKMSYLEKVVAHPEEYIRNPAKIDWDWLRSRLG